MFDDLEKYKQNDHFFFNPTQSLREVCNAPRDRSGVYLVYALAGGRIELIYIGCSGKEKPDGSIFVRKAGLGGLKDRIVNGHQFGKTPRRISWPTQMLIENIEALNVYWYATHGANCSDCPAELEKSLLARYKSIYGKWPRWNRKG